MDVVDERARLVDAGNWPEGTYGIEAEPTAPDWGGNP
jgi:hypothetical protein